MLPLYAFDLFLQVARGMIGCIVGRHSFVDGCLDDVKIIFLGLVLKTYLLLWVLQISFYIEISSIVALMCSTGYKVYCRTVAFLC
jgi:hypothetical protein